MFTVVATAAPMDDPGSEGEEASPESRWLNDLCYRNKGYAMSRLCIDLIL